MRGDKIDGCGDLSAGCALSTKPGRIEKRSVVLLGTMGDCICSSKGNPRQRIFRLEGPNTETEYPTFDFAVCPLLPTRRLQAILRWHQHTSCFAAAMVSESCNRRAAGHVGQWRISCKAQHKVWVLSPFMWKKKQRNGEAVSAI